MSALPVAPNVRVLEHRTYVHKGNRWIALCVVENEYGRGLKFYKWIWRDREQQWKVDLARFSVVDVDLCQMAADAAELARKYGIRLEWPTLDAISNIGVSVQTTPTCPNCDSSAFVESLKTVTSWRCSDCDAIWDQN